VEAIDRTLYLRPEKDAAETEAWLTCGDILPAGIGAPRAEPSHITPDLPRARDRYLRSLQGSAAGQSVIQVLEYPPRVPLWCTCVNSTDCEHP
jgi:hypothetical protein